MFFLSAVWIRRASGCCSLIQGIKISLCSSASGERVASARCSCTIVTSGISGGLPSTISSAWICGQGTQRRQPGSSRLRTQFTPRSPRMANGRFSSVETFWLMVGFRRFQSKVAITTTITTTSKQKIPITQLVIFPARDISVSLPVIYLVKIVERDENGIREAGEAIPAAG